MKDFIPYEYALELKELGFDEECFAHLIGFGDGTKENGRYKINQQQVFYSNDYVTSDDIAEELGLYPFGICEVPLFQQAFKWFRDIHGLYHTIWPEFYRDGINFNWQILWYLPKDEWTKYVISNGTGQYGDNGEYPSQEEAELACLIKLIEIVKNGKSK
jgi:hypothetical protein